MSQIIVPSVTIPEWFAGKNIFITGGSGFMGKVLIEKLLRSCPDINKIYILMREKKGVNPKERIRTMTDLPLFERLKNEQPNAIGKLVPILGDVVQLNLGISEVDRQFLIDNIHIVYHAAASVRFDDPLTDAIMLNTRGTREVANLVREMKHVQILVHVSTTYCNVDKIVIEEEMYPPHADWRAAIKIAEETDRHTLDVLTAKFIEPLPNTYTFTKSMAEHVVKDLCEGVVPAVIYRPSIVISTMSEPIIGWTDNFNGPVGLLVAGGKGILRAALTNPDVSPDFMPVDAAVKGLIIATWKNGAFNSPMDEPKLAVYNASNNRTQHVSNRRMVEIGMQLCWETPLEKVVWYPDVKVTNCLYYYYFMVLFYHVIPAIIVDGVLKLTGRKPMLLKIQRKIFIANLALYYFTASEWKFLNEKSLGLEDELLESDVEAFNFQRNSKLAEPYEYFRGGMVGGRKYLLKTYNPDPSVAKTHTNRMFILATLVRWIFYQFVAYVLIFKMDIIGIFWGKYAEVQEFFNVDAEL